MPFEIVKNEPVAAKRVASPVPFYDLDHVKLKGQTFDHSVAATPYDNTEHSKEVEVWNGSAWVEATNNPTEDGATGFYRYQFTQAETNHDTTIAVALSKTGYETAYYWAQIVNIDVEALESESSDGLDAVLEAIDDIGSGTPQCSHLLSPALIEVNDEQAIYFKVFDVNGEPVTGAAADMDGFLSMDGGAEDPIAGTFDEIDATNMPGVYTYNPSTDELGTIGGATLQVTCTAGEPTWADFSVGFQVVGTRIGIESDSASVDANVVSFEDNVIDEDAIDATAVDKIGLGVWAQSGEGSHTYGDLIRGIVSSVMGPVTGFLTGVLPFMSLNSAKLRFTAVTDDDGRQEIIVGDLSN